VLSLGNSKIGIEGAQILSQGLLQNTVTVHEYK